MHSSNKSSTFAHFFVNKEEKMVNTYTHAERMRILTETVNRVTATPESSRAFLQRAGILDKKGNLTPMYQ